MHHLLKHINQDITYLKMRELGPDALSVVGSGRASVSRAGGRRLKKNSHVTL